MVLNFNSWPPLPFLHVYFLVFLTLHSPHLEASFRSCLSVLGLPWMDPPLIFEWKFVTRQTPDPLVMNSVDGSESRALGTCKRIVSWGDLGAQDQTTYVESTKLPKTTKTPFWSLLLEITESWLPMNFFSVSQTDRSFIWMSHTKSAYQDFYREISGSKTKLTIFSLGCLLWPVIFMRMQPLLVLRWLYRMPRCLGVAFHEPINNISWSGEIINLFGT